jgi:hypothetical protein
MYYMMTASVACFSYYVISADYMFIILTILCSTAAMVMYVLKDDKQ